MKATRLLAAALLVAASCGSDDTESDADPIVPGGADAGPAPLSDGGTQNQCSGVTLEVGTGDKEFAAVHDGDTVYLFKGPQNGFMFFISVRAKGIDPKDATLCYRDILTDGGERNAGEGCWHIQLTNDLGDGVHERVGLWGQINVDYMTVRGHDVRVEVTLSDTKGCSVQGSWSAHVSPDTPPSF